MKMQLLSRLGLPAATDIATRSTPQAARPILLRGPRTRRLILPRRGSPLRCRRRPMPQKRWPSRLSPISPLRPQRNRPRLLLPPHRLRLLAPHRRQPRLPHPCRRPRHLHLLLMLDQLYLISVSKLYSRDLVLGFEFCQHPLGVVRCNELIRP